MSFFRPSRHPFRGGRINHVTNEGTRTHSDRNPSGQWRERDSSAGDRGRGGFRKECQNNEVTRGHGQGRGGGNREYVPKAMSYGRLKTWAESENAGDLILFITSEKQQVETFLNQDKIKEDWLILFIKATNLALTAQHQRESIKQLLKILCTSRFFEHINSYVTEKQIFGSDWADAGKFYKIMMEIIGEILQQSPNFVIKCLTVLTQLLNTLPSAESVRTNKELVDTLTSLTSKAKELHKAQKEKEVCSEGHVFGASNSETPPDDFQTLQVVPTESDLEENTNPFVRRAVTDGAYHDIQHYLDIQFRLMRQDFVHPLRQGILEFKRSGCKPNFTCADLRMYYNVNIVGTVFSDGMDHILQFDISKLKNIKWEFSKRLIFGSLLCLSKDNFNTVVFATVSGRDRKELSKGNVNVNVKSGHDIIFNSTSSDVFIMAETTAYFESYCHVLEGLKEMVSKLPLQDYIIRCKKELKPPKYLLPSGGVGSLAVYNLKCLMKDTSKVTVPVLTTVEWPSADTMCLNESQREAAILALTKELAIIQGPPGTGKTYVGLKVMQVLIENKSVMGGNDENSSDPILVVCYTNHALDQFLEGVLEFCHEGIVRVGGKNTSEKLEQFNIRNLKQEVRKQKFLKDTSIRRAKAECMRELEAVSTQIKTIHADLDRMETDIKSETDLEDHIEHGHLISLQSQGPVQRKHKSKMRIWLNASSSIPQSIVPKMIKNHLTNLILQWNQCSTDFLIQNNMNIIERASLYRSCLAMYITYLTQEQNTLAFAQDYYSVIRIQEIDDLLSQCVKQILPDDELQNVLPAQFFMNLAKVLKVNDKKTIIPLGEQVSYWLLGPHRSLHDQLDDVQLLTNIMTGEGNGVPDFDDEDASKQEQNIRIIDDDDDDDDDKTGLNYSDKTKAAKNSSIVSIMQRVEKLGIKNEDEEDYDDNDGWQHVTYTKPLNFKKIHNKLRTIPPMLKEEESSIVDIWKLDINKRFALYNLWIKRFKEGLTQNMQGLVEQYKSAYERKKQANSEEELYLLRSARVIGMTTTGAAKHRAVLQSVGCRIIVVEEAAEVLESHIVTALNKNCNHLILIGDHQQLRPSPAVYDLAKHFGLEISLFERLVKNKVPHVVLEEQHRMRPEIANLMRHIYPHLQDHSSVFKYDHIRGVAKNIFIIQHTEMETHVDDTRSKANIHEAKYLVGLCCYLLFQGYEASQITVLATYAGQVFAIKKVMRDLKFEHRVRVTAVDNFQGEENDIILLSLVRSNTTDSVGFLKVDNRVCVALSRAKKGLFVIGNIELLAKNSQLWSNIMKTAMSNGIFGEGLPLICQNHPEFKQFISCVEDFEKCPEGGCGLPCNYKLSCGHVCAKTCHGYDLDHKNYKCGKPCGNQCKDGHPCTRKCYQDCGDCTVPVLKKIPACGHEDRVQCYLPVDKAVCQQQCSEYLECDHQCPGTCGNCKKQGKHAKCIRTADYSWPCGHICKVPCYKKPTEYPCPSKCGLVLDCGHKCIGECSECLRGAVHVACGERCDKILPCGHQCPSFCGTLCLPCTENCPGKCRHSACSKSSRKDKTAPQCGHTCIPCREECKYRCAHAKCSKKCTEECDIQPCDKKCQRRKNPCNHSCCGLCGELCVCKKCDKVTPLDAYTENDELMNEYDGEETAAEKDGTAKAEANKNGNKKRLLIKIPSCQHIFYVDELDKYVSSFEPGKASYIGCPVCQKPIQKCLRYENINKERSWRREAEKNKIKKETAITPHDLKKLERSQEMLEDSQLMSRFRNMLTAHIKDKAEVNAKSFVLKSAFVLSEIASLEKSERSTVSSQHVNSLKGAMLKIQNRITTQLKREFTTELQRCFWLAQLQNLERLGNLHDVEVPSQLEADVSKCKETLGQLKPEMADLERAKKVTEILRRRIKELATETTVSAKCILLEGSTERIMKILASEDKDMLCDLLKEKKEFTEPFHKFTEKLKLLGIESAAKPTDRFGFLITKEVDADYKEAKAEQKKQERANQGQAESLAASEASLSSGPGLKRPSVGDLGSVLSKINKKSKMATLVKTSGDEISKAATGSKPESEGNGKAGKVTITKVFDFAGEEIKITKEVGADYKEAKAEQKKQERANQEQAESLAASAASLSSGPGLKRPSVGDLGSVLSKINKKSKMATLVKTSGDEISKAATGSKPESEGNGKAGKVTITKVFDFAGEEIKITKEVGADYKEAKAEQKKQERANQEQAESLAASEASLSSGY